MNFFEIYFEEDNSSSAVLESKFAASIIENLFTKKQSFIRQDILAETLTVSTLPIIIERS